jgi:murein L,D-transpeptidase YafK
MIRAILAVILALNLFAGAADAKTIIKRVPAYHGPEITQILIDKSARKMYLLSGKKTVRKFKIDLGFSPNGHKSEQGDGRTPEGLYFIDRVNTNSRYFLSLGINYPNNKDRELADAAGVDPGGDIFIHGGPRYRGERGKRDWTAGCVSVSDREMGWVYSMVKLGTPVFIKP